MTAKPIITDVFWNGNAKIRFNMILPKVRTSHNMEFLAPPKKGHGHPPEGVEGGAAPRPASSLLD